MYRWLPVPDRCNGVLVPLLRDGVVSLRAPSDKSDVDALLATRDSEWERWLGSGSREPAPAACIEVGGSVVGWVDIDQDSEHSWLLPGELNIGYALGPTRRGYGYATRAVRLLVHYLAWSETCTTATLLIDPGNAASNAVAERAGFAYHGEVDGQLLFKRSVPPVTYTDGVVTLRPQSPDSDLEAHLEATDDAQMEWLWQPGDRELWEAKSLEEQRMHQESHLTRMRDSWGYGPKWAFSADLEGVPYAVFVDCDLANDGVRHGEANISYAAHPRHRGKSYVSRSVRLIVEFLRENTGAKRAYIRVDPRNDASLRVARAVGAIEESMTTTEHGHPRVTFRLDLR